ncbi:AAEL010959-PA [Aedes aegypti]|uniref:AAEL010959-PA n=1 Tax=Aedes aegypti TaxID=7159 RepID=Q16RG7_AEDAE|nr:AAEL010959-PA [Aedes aegypti]
MMLFVPLIIVIGSLGVQAEQVHSPRVANGNLAAHVPHNAYILYKNDQLGGFFGGGTIISDRHILTAAQNIVEFTQWDVGVGSNVFHQLSTITSREATAHPEFDPIISANDIGIITLPGSLEFTSNVFPIALPDLNSEQTELLPLENEEGVILGFGFTSTASMDRSDFLMHTFQRVTADERCQRFYQIEMPQHFCAEDNGPRQSNLCIRDVGAGFATYVRGRLTLTGIASLIRERCDNRNPTGYVRIDYYREWIHNVTQI